jgi:hypothetical protein
MLIMAAITTLCCGLMMYDALFPASNSYDRQKLALITSILLLACSVAFIIAFYRFS